MQCTASKITFNVQNWLCWRHIKMIFNFLGLSKDIGTQYTLYCPVVVVNMFQTMSNVILGTKIVDWCINTTRSSFLGFQVGRTKGGDCVYYLYWNIRLLFLALYCFVRTETATPVFYSFKESTGGLFCRNSVWGIHARRSFCYRSKTDVYIPGIHSITKVFFNLHRRQDWKSKFSIHLGG